MNTNRGLFGTCAAIGEDFGFNPEWLRAALVLALLWNAVWVLGGYAAASLLVLASRRLVPSRCAAPAVERHEAVAEPDYALAA